MIYLNWNYHFRGEDDGAMGSSFFWEHNGNDTLLWSIRFPGAFTRGPSLKEAMAKMPGEIESYCLWAGIPFSSMEIDIKEEKSSELDIKDADTDCIFQSEQKPLTKEAYHSLRDLALKSAQDFLALYKAIPDKKGSALTERKTFYGNVPITAEDMYEHTKNVNSYYFGEIGIDVDNAGTIYDCRLKGFQILEQTSNFLENNVFEGSYGEFWSLAKVLRRFIWHDRIHAKAMYRMAKKTFPEIKFINPFLFQD